MYKIMSNETARIEVPEIFFPNFMSPAIVSNGDKPAFDLGYGFCMDNTLLPFEWRHKLQRQIRLMRERDSRPDAIHKGLISIRTKIRPTIAIRKVNGEMSYWTEYLNQTFDDFPPDLALTKCKLEVLIRIFPINSPHLKGHGLAPLSVCIDETTLLERQKELRETYGKGRPRNGF